MSQPPNLIGLYRPLGRPRLSTPNGPPIPMSDTEQFDLFRAYLVDLPLRDQREMMERPFFSLSKRKRMKPIEYTSPDGTIWVKVAPHQDYGMATIWDADILIWAISQINERRQQGLNDIPRTLVFHPHALLTAIGRHTGGDQYERLREAFGRLKTTTVSTNIRAKGRRKTALFSWLDEWREEYTETGTTKQMAITLSEWLVEGILNDRALLRIDRRYFDITSGYGRVLYRVARKHAGDQPAGFELAVRTIYEKSGADDVFRNFKSELKRVVTDNALPEYHFTWIARPRGEDAVHMVRRSHLSITDPGYELPVRQRRKTAALVDL